MAQSRQGQAGDAVAGEQDGVTAVGADVEYDYRSVSCLLCQPLGRGRQREGAESLQGADSGQQLCELFVRLPAVPDGLRGGGTGDIAAREHPRTRCGSWCGLV